MMTRSTVNANSNSNSSSKPYAYIVEQPAKCGVRFRYECEGRISSAIPGASSTTSRFTYPTVAVANYSGPIKVIVSCVTKNPPYRPHPHNLVGKQFCSQGVCVALFGEPYAVFNNLGILCAKRKDVKERLRVREQLQIDPFATGFSHRLHTFKLIDLNVVRLCFQVFLMDSLTGKYSIALEPVVSTEIFDKKAMSELSIAKLSHYSGHISGGQSVVMLCDRVLKEDIQIRFYQTDCASGQTVWERMAHFNASDIHKHFAITFTVPPYELSLATDEESIPVQVQLRRPSDGCTSDSVTFYYSSSSRRDDNNSAVEASFEVEESPALYQQHHHHQKPSVSPSSSHRSSSSSASSPDAHSTASHNWQQSSSSTHHHNHHHLAIKSEFAYEDDHSIGYQISCQLSADQELFEQQQQQSPMFQQHSEQLLYHNEHSVGNNLLQQSGSCNQILVSPPEEFIWSSGVQSEMTMQQQQHPHHSHPSPNMLLDISQNVVRTDENTAVLESSPHHYSFAQMTL